MDPPLTATPEDVGLSSERLGRVAALTHGYVDSGRLPFVMTQIARRGHVVYRDAYGWADVEAQRPIALDAIVRIYSMTKPIVSLALMQLYEQGEVLLENPVSRWIPALGDRRVWAGGTADDHQTVAAERDITVHDVLTHVSGLTTGFQYRHPVDELYRRHHLGELTVAPDYDLARAMELLGELPLLHQPGARWSYGMSTEVVARLVEVISGQRIDDYLRAHIFEPLGMLDTAFHAPGDRADRLATLYTRTAKARLQPMGGKRLVTGDAPPTFLSGAGGLVSTLDDYQRFCDALLGGGAAHGVRIIGPRTLAAMATNQLPGGALLNDLGQDTFTEVSMDGQGFGLGVSVVVDPAAQRSVVSRGEYGWGGAASTVFWIDPAEELSALFLTHLLPSNVYPIRRQLRAVVNQAIVS